MQYLGRILVTAIGFFTFAPVGLGVVGGVIGFIIGLIFDKGRLNIGQGFDPEARKLVEKALFETVYPLIGKLAKSDGRVSEEEIEFAEQLIRQMGLSAEQRQLAIQLFKQGSETNFDIDPVLERFASVCGNYNNIKQLLLVYIISIAYADGELHSAEEAMLEKVADRLGYSRIAFNHLLGMVKAQSYFQRGQQQQSWRSSQEGPYRNQQKNSQDELKLAYEALGVESTISDVELKRAYRRLMSEYHPDKLAGRGVPEDMVKLATERSQEIQVAYDMVKKSRE